MGTGPLRITLLSAVTADETTSPGVDCSAYTQLVAYLKGTGTITSGVLTIEETDQPPPAEGVFDGRTWSQIQALNAADVTGDVQLAYHFPSPYAYGFVRVRVSTAVGGGGSLTVVLRGVA